MKRYYVVGSFIGECCTGSHLYAEKVDAPSPEKARQFIKALMERQGYDVGEIIVSHRGKQLAWFQAH